MKHKIYYTKENLTPDIDCSLKPPVVLHGAETETKHYDIRWRGWQSAPCILKTPKGRLYCTYSGDNSDAPDETPNNYNLISVSRDGGKTWHDAEWVIDHPDSVRMHEPTLWLAPDGALWHFWAQSYNWWDGRGGLWAMRCPDPDADEITWSEPRRLCDGVLATTPMLSRTGEWFFPVSIWKCYKSQYHDLPELSYSNVYVSRDGGQTLEYVGHADEPDTTFDENSLEERPDGSFIMIMRTSDAIAAAESFDRGKTWTKPIRMMDSPSSRSFLRRFPSGNLLLVAHDDFMEPDRDKAGIPTAQRHPERKNLTAFLSEDGGKTWPYKLLLDGACQISYPCGMIDGDGRAHVAYDRERYARREIYYASFTEADIRAGKTVEASSFVRKLVVKGGENCEICRKSYEDGNEQKPFTLHTRYAFPIHTCFASAHASTVVRLKNGRVAVACFGGTAEGASDVQIWLSLQQEDGTFGKPKCFSTEPGVPCWNPVLFRNGDRLVLYFKTGKNPREWFTMYCVSEDEGESWTAPAELVPGDRNDGRGPVKNKPIILSDGTILAPLSVETNGNWQAGVDRSEDGGKTWTSHLIAPAPLTARAQALQETFAPEAERGFIQPALWESAPNQVHMLLRSTYARIYRSDSTDGGKTWCPIYETELPNNNSGLDVAQRAGRLYLVCNPVAQNWGARTPLTVFVSEDNGAHFTPLQCLESDSGEYSYPSIIASPDRLDITYTWERKTIRHCTIQEG